MSKKIASYIHILAMSLVGGLILTGTGCEPNDTNVNTNTANQNKNASTVTTVSKVQPTSWETFTSPLMGYTIDYPSTWNTWSGSERFEDMQDPETDADYFSILSAADSFTISPDQIFIAIDKDTKQALVPGEAATEDFNDVIAANSQGEIVSNVQALVVDDTLPAVQQVEQNPDDTTGEYGYKVVTYVDAGKSVYTIHVTVASAEDYSRYADVIATMIESFDKE